jgi:hybrid cluster-associated redox disulfide protein
MLVVETMSMDEIMRKWPATIRVVIRHHMLCVGCPIAPFHTLADACREHGVDEAAFLRAIRRGIDAS